ncbi:protein MULTIPOLAR SPINDLE 1 [Phragmites australis]|uniref:protein MULTIPOLAR SPINDLE 1 n=1 Tax=Phragmites australis TaxID=29695 RepID=UPI002D786509|nr:protein MULTIPOLAR SPINDLE 1 [Phragmites australis]XP_062196826.1 protein MULTIPOLAR SPINDLE 1 [Phragmites australis]
MAPLPPSRPPTPTTPAETYAPSSRIDSPSLKAALAMALIHYNRLPGKTATDAAAAATAGTSSPPLLHWKRKAKDRKREILHLREELKLLHDGVRGEEMEPPVASCRCHFFDGCADLRPQPGGDGGEHWVDEVLRRRFLRLVRWKEKRRRVDRPLPRISLIDFNSEDEMQQLSLSTDFLVELSDGISAKREAGSTFATFSHQAVDFILASLKNILSSEREKELVEEIIDGLVTRLMKRMCTIPENDGSVDCSDAQFSVQHLFRKLGNAEFIGQRIILAVSQKISNVSERLLLVDPFDDAFPDMHGNIFIMIQLIEFLISDYMKDWIHCEHFDKRLSEECARSILKARMDLQVLENMNGLYVVYIERVVGRLARELAPAVHQGKLDLEVFSKLLC